MKAELICVGSELVSGSVLNTNASYISKKLRELGHDSFRQFTVDDNIKRIKALVEESLKACDILIVCGGLGPTDDDVTKEAVCGALGLALVENKACADHIKNYFAALGKKPTPNNLKQALAPADAKIFPNTCGTACGIGIELGEKRIILLPGPPKELSAMFENSVIPYLKKLDHRVFVTHTLNVFGMGESAIETVIKPFCLNVNPTVATYCKENECDIVVTARGYSDEEAEEICAQTLSQIKSLLGDVVYGIDSKGLAFETVALLRASSLKIATAESCTGGMLSQALTSVPHASEAVEIGILAYSNRIKNEALSVPHDVLNESGAISAETAMYLAKNVRILSDADIGVGITGNAGPSASENKPVGLVYVAIADKTKYLVKKLQLPAGYGRDRIRSYATLTALDLVRKYVNSRPAQLEGMVSLDSEFHFNEEPDTPPAPTPINSNSFAVFEVADEQDFEDLYEATQNDSTTADAPSIPNSFSVSTGGENGNLWGNIKNFVKNNTVKIVAVAVLLALIISSAALVGNFIDENHQLSLIKQARSSFDFSDAQKYEDSNRYCAFDELLELNSDIKAWINIPNTEVNNPVYQSDDNSYYLSHNMNKEKSSYGALFFDSNNQISSDGSSQNLTVYGYNIDNDAMFGSLDGYRSLSYYKNNSIIKLKTLFEQKDYLIFAVMVTNADPNDDNGNLYNYTRSDFSSEQDFLSWIEEAKKRSLIVSNIEIQPDDQILTLSTGCDDFKNARFVVMAKRLDDGDSANVALSATLNTNAKYPQAWYDENKLEGYKEASSDNSSVSESSSEQVSSELPSSSEEVTVSSASSSTGAVSSAASSTVSSAASSTVPSSSPSSTAQIACQHSSDGHLTLKNGTHHTYTCSKCGNTVEEAHAYTEQSVLSNNLCSSATCTSAATYYKTCKCSAVGTETFSNGEPLGHNADTSDYKSDAAEHWHSCTNGCDEKLNAAAHTYGENDECVCGQHKPTEQSDNN